MLLIDIFKIPVALSLGVIATVLAVSVIGSLLFPKAAHTELPEDEHREVLQEPLSD